MLRNDRKILKLFDFRYASVRAEKFLYTFKILQFVVQNLSLGVWGSVYWHRMTWWHMHNVSYVFRTMVAVKSMMHHRKYCQKLRLLFVFGCCTWNLLLLPNFVTSIWVMQPQMRSQPTLSSCVLTFFPTASSKGQLYLLTVISMITGLCLVLFILLNVC